MKLSKLIAKYKIYLDRSRTYVNYIQLAMIMKLFFSDIKIESNLLLLVGIVVCFTFLIVLGYLDTKFGIRAREMENNSLHNPVMKEIYNILKENQKDGTVSQDN